MPESRIDDVISELLKERRDFTAPEVAARADVSRQAAHKALRRLLESGVVEAEGAARARRYFAAGSKQTSDTWKFTNRDLDEDVVWTQVKSSRHFRALGSNAAATARYAFTEIFNNAIDHSGSAEINVQVGTTDRRLRVTISDQGVGIFAQIQKAYRLKTPMEALAELSKGKVTTRPDRHTGEGIFFVSKATDLFEIDSGGLRWTVDNMRNDTAVGEGTPRRIGTLVRYEIDVDKRETLEDLFRQYTTEFEFDRTRTLVRLFTHGTQFVSRSEAKRLLAGLEKFREVILDFDRVASIGQGFADEVFRVWARDHPTTELRSVNMNTPVEFMVKRALESAKPDGTTSPDT
ncbi:MAG TPA: DUF4325 domain-containing protein [Vicinamibacterales bacterium]|nr:DUF4325 domain-containing protein [Vicinamibacterales bacterium]